MSFSKLFCIFLLLVVCVGPMMVYAQDKVPAITLKDARLDDVVRMLAEKAQINLVLTQEIDKKVSIQLKDSVDPLRLLEVLVTSYGYKLVKIDNIYTLEAIKVEEKSGEESSSLETQLGIASTSGMDEAPINSFQLQRTPVEQVEGKIRNLVSPLATIEINREANSIYVLDNKENLKKVKDFVDFLNLDPSSAFSARVQQRSFKYNRLNAEKLEENIRALLTQDKGKFVLDAASKTIVVTDTEDALNRVANFINTADQPEPQVYIRCHMVEVTLTGNTETGFSFADNDGWKLDDITGSYGYNVKPVQEIQDQHSFGFTTKDGIAVDFSAIANRNNSRLLSSPNLLCSNNEVSKIEVIKEIPYTQSETDLETGVTTVTVEFKEAGISLSVTPQIYSDGTVHLDLEGEVSEEVERFKAGETISVPVIKKKTVQSKVIAKDKQTVVIGGILEDSLRKTKVKVPLLGDIPLLGILFSNERQEMVKTELLIFMNITIVDHRYMEKMGQEEWKKQQATFEKLDTEFEFYPHLKQPLKMEELNPDYDKTSQPLSNLNSKSSANVATSNFSHGFQK